MTSDLEFPEIGYFGIPAQIAEFYASNYETPKEFVYIDLLVMIGALLSGRWEVDLGELNTQPRLYAVKIAPSAWRRKSQATRFAEASMKRVLERVTLGVPEDSPLLILYGAGSAEGLIGRFRRLKQSSDSQEWIGTARIALSFDELRRFEKKAHGESSVLLEAVNELYDRNEYDNPTKGEGLKARNAHLAFIANTTEATWQTLLGASELEDIGFTNRLFLVYSDKKKRVAIPDPKGQATLELMEEDLAELLKRLPKIEMDGTSECIGVELTPEAREMWTKYYENMPESPETARLDAMGPRLMAILTFISSRTKVDEEIVRSTIALLEYQRKVRAAFRPIVAESKEAKLEAVIDHQYHKGQPLSKRECFIAANGRRWGSDMFDHAYEHYKLRYLQPAPSDGSRAVRWELKPEFRGGQGQ